MQNPISTRDFTRSDLASARAIIDATGLFPAEMLDAMAEPCLAEQAPHIWLSALGGGELVGFAYVEPERMTEGTFNMLLIAVHPQWQGVGVGKALVSAFERKLRDLGARVLIVETSSSGEFARARALYGRQGFVEEARVRDFYAEGEHKILFWKHL